MKMKRLFSILSLLLLAGAAPFLEGTAWGWNGKLGWTFKAEAPITSSVAVGYSDRKSVV